MVTREDVVAEIQKVPEQHLEAIYRIIKDFRAGAQDDGGADENVMSRLRRIKISAAPDLSTKADLYDVGEPNGGG